MDLKDEVKKLEERSAYLKILIQSDELRQKEQHKFADEAEARYAVLKQMVVDIEKAVEKLRSEMRDLEISKNVLQRECFDIQNEKETLAKGTDELHERIGHQNNEKIKNEIDLAEQRMQSENFSKDIVQKKADLDSIGLQIEAGKSSLREVMQKLSTTTRLLNEEEKKLDESRKKAMETMADLVQRKDALIEEIAQLDYEIATKRHDDSALLEALQQKLKDIEAELTVTSQRLTDMIDKQEKIILEHKQEIVQLSSDKENLRKTIQKLEVKKVELEMYGERKSDSK